MKPLVIAERVCLIAHVVSTLFGLAGLLLVLPNPEMIMNLPAFGQAIFQWSMAGGGVVYIIFGAAAMAIYADRTLGRWAMLTFLLPSVLLSLSSELLGTSTGFPFGHYQYLSGLGYKVAGLVPFTIPLSWFYMGITCYLLARAGLKVNFGSNWFRYVGAIAVGAVLLTAWDLVLDPAMSQAPMRFWEFQEVGEFFGMPYRNLVGWVGTGFVYMSVAAFFWRQTPIFLSRPQLTTPLIVYLTNFIFGAVITALQLDSRFLLPITLSVLIGVLPAVFFWWTSQPHIAEDENFLAHDQAFNSNSQEIAKPPVEIALKSN